MHGSSERILRNRTVTKVVLKHANMTLLEADNEHRTVTKVVLKQTAFVDSESIQQDRTVTKVVLKQNGIQILTFDKRIEQ